MPTNRTIAERAGWLCQPSGRPNTSKVKRVAAELEGLGVLARGLEDDGRSVRRTSIRLALPGFDPPPAQIQATPPGSNLALPQIPAKPHWVEGVRREVMHLLKAVASEGSAILPGRLWRVAGLVQAELAGFHAGGGSELFHDLVTAVSMGYDPSIVDAAIERAGQGRCPMCRADIRDIARRLAPDPRDWLRAERMTTRAPRTNERGWAYGER